MAYILYKNVPFLIFLGFPLISVSFGFQGLFRWGILLWLSDMHRHGLAIFDMEIAGSNLKEFDQLSYIRLFTTFFKPWRYQPWAKWFNNALNVKSCNRWCIIHTNFLPLTLPSVNSIIKSNSFTKTGASIIEWIRGHCKILPPW